SVPKRAFNCARTLSKVAEARLVSAPSGAASLAGYPLSMSLSTPLCILVVPVKNVFVINGRVNRHANYKRGFARPGIHTCSTSFRLLSALLRRPGPHPPRLWFILQTVDAAFF